MGRQLECSNVQTRHNEEDKHKLRDEDTKINLVKGYGEYEHLSIL